MKVFFSLLVGILLGAGGIYVWLVREKETFVSPGEVILRPLDAYTIENLANRKFESSTIELSQKFEDAETYTSYLFSMHIDGKYATGFANIPKKEPPDGGFPVIVQLRGYVPKELFASGVGTKRSGQVYAQNGFITLAPDFLGYGGSDNPSTDIFEERFQTYIVASTLLASVDTMDLANPEKIGLWGHSNGGQIALTSLEISGRDIPTVLWAPVTKIFPYSILYYTDEASDSGKFLREKLAKFESLYDTDLYAFTNFIGKIRAPIQIHQGTLDDAVPRLWTNTFAGTLKKKGISITYFEYPGADHNLNSSAGAWDQAVRRDIEFYKEKLDIK